MSKEKHIQELKDLGWTKSFRAIRLLEIRANRLAEKYCNDEVDYSIIEAGFNRIKDELKEGFGGKLPDGFFINQDPRGYQLKLENNSAISFHDDYASILAPNFD